ncbi:MAG: aconitate hydratase AcnA, partial [Deltaproteobacteria bacterium]|nr:aconitate hydratase AcnA [Deltaproteobacteria bacterium]
DPKAVPSHEIAFMPSRVILQDFTGVPAVVDLAAMRDAIVKMGGDASKINPLRPAELVIDHSVQVDKFGTDTALDENTIIEYERNKERYQFLRWGAQAFENFKVVPPSTGIVHQVNLEHLARVVMNEKDTQGRPTLFPDTLVGTDSHTTMINGLGILGWGVGGIEAEAAMLGQPISMLIPQVIGFKLVGQLPEGATATDLVLTVTQMLRKKGVVGKFVEFFGPGLDTLPLADRATISNMAPEYGATCGIFPVDETTLAYLRLTGKDEKTVNTIAQYYKLQGMFRTSETLDPEYTDVLTLDMSTVQPSLAGPSRPQDRILLKDMQSSFEKSYDSISFDTNVNVSYKNQDFKLSQGDVVIAAITSCTNTSNPSVMIAAGLLAQKAIAKGLQVKPWTKTSLAPGSKVVTDYLDKAGLSTSLNQLGFQTVGYGCTTCIGNSGPLPEPIEAAIDEKQLTVASVLSGNRNFEGRVHGKVRASYLASPPLVVAYALAGNVRMDLTTDPLGQDQQGKDVFLKDIWPTQEEVQNCVLSNVDAKMFQDSYADVFEGDAHWKSITSSTGKNYHWDEASTYVKHPPFFENMAKTPGEVQDIQDATVLSLLEDSITTDHISPAGAIAKDSPAAKYLESKGVERKLFNSYGSRRGNHEVMMRGTFANVRIKNQLLDHVEGGYTKFFPTGETLSIFDAAMKYQEANTPLVVLAGKEYGTGSSRDWAAKGSFLLGIKAVIAQSFERIHRSNLIGMGVLPLQFKDGESTKTLGLDGTETISIIGLAADYQKVRELSVTAKHNNGNTTTFQVQLRLDTPKEREYYQHGGILQYVLRQMV